MFEIYQDRMRERTHPRVLQALRITQFLAAIISIIMYIVYVIRKATTSSSNGAVLGILAGAVVFTLISLAKACFMKRKIVALVLLFLLFDILFVAAYIAVAALTGGPATGRSCRAPGGDEDDDDSDDSDGSGGSRNCNNLVKGVFALSIINIIQHLLSSAIEHFHKPPTSIKHPTRSGNIAG